MKKALDSPARELPRSIPGGMELFSSKAKETEARTPAFLSLYGQKESLFTKRRKWWALRHFQTPRIRTGSSCSTYSPSHLSPQLNWSASLSAPIGCKINAAYWKIKKGKVGIPQAHRLFLFFLQLVFSSALALGADHVTIACVGGRVYPSPTAPAIENAVLLIEDGKFARVAPQSEIKYDLPQSAQIGTAA